MSASTRTPLRLVPLVVLALALLGLPLAALLVRVPWGGLLDQLGRPALRETLALSLWTSASAALLAACLGLPLAAWLASGGGPLRSLARVLVTLPVVLPPVVGGLALLLAFGRAGLVTGPLGVQLPFTAAAVVLAQTFVALPFLVIAAEAGLRAVDARHLEAAETLGASPWLVLVRVRVPLARAALAAGLLLAWARALGEFGATITFAGSLQGVTRTLPLALFSALEEDPETALVLGAVLVGLAVLVLTLLRGRWLPRLGGSREERA